MASNFFASAGAFAYRALWAASSSVRTASSSADGRPGEDRLEGERQTLGVGLAAFRQNSFGKHPGRFDVLRVVQQLQGLERRIAAVAPAAGLFAVRRVEVGHVRRRGGAFEEGVQRPAIDRVALVALVEPGVRSRVRDRLPDVIRLVRLHALAAECEVQAGRRRRGRCRALARRRGGSGGRGRGNGFRGRFRSTRPSPLTIFGTPSK